MSNLATYCDTTYCVFRRGSTWFAFPAENVREVCERPTLVAVPGSTNVLAGLCHFRSEFTPVIRLDHLLTEDGARLGEEPQMLVVQSGDGAWGVLADEVRALVSLEPSAGEEVTDMLCWTSAITGWAAWEAESVRVLHASNLRDLIESELTRSWSDKQHGGRGAASDSTADLVGNKS